MTDHLDLLDIPAAITRIDAARSREDLDAVLANWHDAHWAAWVKLEIAARAADAAASAASGDEYSKWLEPDGAWRVDYLPRALHRAEVRALNRLVTLDEPVEVYDRTVDAS